MSHKGGVGFIMAVGEFVDDDIRSVKLAGAQRDSLIDRV